MTTPDRTARPVHRAIAAVADHVAATRQTIADAAKSAYDASRQGIDTDERPAHEPSSSG